MMSKFRFFVVYLILPVIVITVIVGCSVDNYETGDGEYSYMTSAFSMLDTDSQGKAVSFVTDDDSEYTITSPLEIKGAKPDTTYRVLAYYNETATKKTALRGIKTVYVLRPRPAESILAMSSDPVTFSSMWTSANGKYLNLGFYLMEGVADKEDQTTQALGMAVSCNPQSADAAHKSYNLTLLHSQNGVPEYYKTLVYASVPLDGYQQNDTLNIIINTYDGTCQKTVIVP